MANERDPNTLRNRLARFEGYAASRDSNWFHEGTRLKVVERELGWKIAELVKEKLASTKGKVVVLDAGCGYEPAALNDLAKRFRDEVEAGRLELHGLNLSKEATEVRTNDAGVKIHNSSPRDFARKGIRADLAFDHLGSLLHASDAGDERLVLVYLSALGRCLAPGGRLRFNVCQERDVPGRFDGKKLRHEVRDTGNTSLYHTQDGGSETFFRARVYEMHKKA